MTYADEKLQLTTQDFIVTPSAVHIVDRLEHINTRPGYLRPLTALKVDGSTFPDRRYTIIWVMAGSWSHKAEISYDELLPETPDELRNLMAAVMLDASPTDWKYLLDVEELRELLYEARGESSACNDGECSCHRVPAELEELMEELGLEEVPA